MDDKQTSAMEAAINSIGDSIADLEKIIRLMQVESLGVA